MSKSKGNGVDPLAIIEKFGADAARLAVLTGATPGNDSRFSEDKAEAKRNFINKLWNISRFILTSAAEKEDGIEAPAETASDRWILGELDALISRVTGYLNDFDFSLAADELTEFTRDKLADWYLEIAKIEKGKEKLLVEILKKVLILWHPFIPFVTEKIWSGVDASLLMTEKWPVASGKAPADSGISILQDLVVAIRNARSANKIEPAKKLDAVIYAGRQTEFLKQQKELIQGLKTGLQSVEIKESGPAPEKAIAATAGTIEIYLLGGVDPEAEKKRLGKEQQNLEKVVASQSAKLANADFISRAPAAIVAAEKEKLAAYQAELDKINKIIASL